MALPVFRSPRTNQGHFRSGISFDFLRSTAGTVRNAWSSWTASREEPAANSCIQFQAATSGAQYCAPGRWQSFIPTKLIRSLQTGRRADHFIFLALVILRYTSIVIHLPSGIEFRNRRASRHRNIDRLLRRVAPLNLATPRFRHLLENRFLGMSVVPPSARHARRHGTLVEVRFHADPEGPEVREERHGHLLGARRGAERGHGLLERPLLDAWGALRRAHVHRREAVGRADDVRRLLEAPRVEAPAREHGVRARVRLHSSFGDYVVVKLECTAHLTVLEARVDQAGVDVHIRLQVEALTGFLDHGEGLVQPPRAAEELHEDGQGEVRGT